MFILYLLIAYEIVTLFISNKSSIKKLFNKHHSSEKKSIEALKKMINKTDSGMYVTIIMCSILYVPAFLFFIAGGIYLNTTDTTIMMTILIIFQILDYFDTLKCIKNPDNYKIAGYNLKNIIWNIIEIAFLALIIYKILLSTEIYNYIIK